MEVQDIPGRGLGVVATRTLQSGEVIVNDLPILLYPQASAIQDVCSFCLRWLSAPGKTSILSKLKYYYFTPNATISKHQPILYSLNYAGIVPIACSSCASAGFCSPQCAAAADAPGGTAPRRTSYGRIAQARAQAGGDSSG